MSYLYRTYGLTLESTFPLPELEPAPAGAAPDVTMREGIIDHPLPDDETDRGCYEANAEEAFVWYRDVGQLHIRHGREIIIDPAQDGAERLRHHILQGMALGIVLHQRGVLTLHASGVELDGRAAIFIGWKRMGKSTTAASFYAAGHRLLTDDIIVLDLADGTTVHPGFSQIRLDPEAVAKGLGIDPDDIPRIHENYEKRSGRAEQGFDLTPLPLGHIFVLAWGEDFEVEALRGREALTQLLTHSYAPRFLGNVAATPQHLKQVGLLVDAVPVTRLTKPNDLDRLPELITLVREAMATAKPALDHL